MLAQAAEAGIDAPKIVIAKDNQPVAKKSAKVSPETLHEQARKVGANVSQPKVKNKKTKSNAKPRSKSKQRVGRGK